MLDLFAEALVWLEVADPIALWHHFLGLLLNSGDAKVTELQIAPPQGHVAAELHEHMQTVLAHYHLDMIAFGIDRPACPDFQTDRRSFGQRELDAEIPTPASIEEADKCCKNLKLSEKSCKTF